MKNYLSVVAAAAALSGCAVTLTDKAAKIQVHNQMSTLLANCKTLGPVEAMGEDVWVGTPVATTKAKVFLREKTADLGGDTVVIINADYIGETKVVLQGVSMKCY